MSVCLCVCFCVSVSLWVSVGVRTCGVPSFICKLCHENRNYHGM